MNATLKQLRESLIAEIDPALREPDPMVVLYLAVSLSIYWTLFFVVFNFGGYTYLLAFPMGLLLQLVSNANHEILHGNVVGSKVWITLLPLPGMFLNLTSPHFWVYTHHFHHRALDLWTSNSTDSDGSAEISAPSPSKSIWGKVRFVLNYFIFNSLRFRLKQFSFLFELGPRRILQRSKFVAIFLEVVGICFFHSALAYILGPLRWLGIVLVPLIIFCLISSCFFITSHSRELWTANSGQIRIFSVRTCRLIDDLFFCLGYHVEHHLFPDTPQKNLRQIERFLEKKGLFQEHKFNHLWAIKTAFTHAYRERFGPSVDGGSQSHAHKKV